MINHFVAAGPNLFYGSSEWATLANKKRATARKRKPAPRGRYTNQLLLYRNSYFTRAVHWLDSRLVSANGWVAKYADRSVKPGVYQ